MNLPKQQPPTEARKDAATEKDHAESIAYTVNHAISCGLTDIVVQPVAAVAATSLVQEEVLPKWMRWITHIFEDHSGHSHGKDAPCDHHGHSHSHAHGHAKPHGPVIIGSGMDKFRAEAAHAPAAASRFKESSGRWARVWANIKHEMQWKNFSHNLGHWATGETVGDVGGVVPTILVQRFFPEFMHGIRTKLEPLASKAYRNGAHRDARHWGEKRGLDANDPAVRAKEEELFEHEMKHLPQAALWNAFSIPLNFAVQFAMSKPQERNTLPRFAKFLTKFTVGKTFGSFFSNGILLGGRAVAPEAFIAWDRWNSRYIIQPVLTGPGKLLGIDQKTVDKVANHSAQHDAEPWTERTRATAEENVKTIG